MRWIRGDGRFRWVRAIEGLAVGAVVLVLFTYLLGWDRVAAELARVDPVVYLLAFPAMGLSLLAWSEAVGLLVEPHDGGVGRRRVSVVFVAAIAVRSLVPGGSISAPVILAYFLRTYTAVDVEEGIATATLAQFCFWLASVVIAGVGFAGMVLGHSPGREVTSIAVTLGVVVAMVIVIVGIGVRYPTLVERPVRWIAALVRNTVGRVSIRVRDGLDPTAVERRIERFLAAFRRLGDHPRELAVALVLSLVGWALFVSPLWLSFRALGVSVSPAVVMFVVPVAGVTSGLSVLPGGIGAVEGSMIGLLSVLTPLSLGMVGTGVMLGRLVTFWFRLLLGGGSLLYLSVTKRSFTGLFEAEGQA